MKIEVFREIGICEECLEAKAKYVMLKIRRSFFAGESELKLLCKDCIKEGRLRETILRRFLK